VGHTRDRGRDAPRRWQGVAQLTDGRRPTKTFDRRGDAERWWQETEQQDRSGGYVDPAAGRVLLRDLAERVLVERAASLRNHSNDKRRSLWRNQVEPYLGALPISAIQHSTVRAWVAAVSARWHPETVRAAYRLLKEILDVAVEDDRLVRNPATDKRGRPPANMPAGRPPEIRVLEPAEMTALLRAAPGEYRRPLVLGYGAGLRWEEVAGLHLARTRDGAGLDLERHEVRVREVLEETRAGLSLRPYPKSSAGRRTIPLAPTVVAVLAAGLEETPAGSRGQLCLGPDGGWLRRSNFARRVMRPAFERAELALPRATFHDLRHTYATELLAGGLDIETLRHRLGHSDQRMVSRYTHLAHDARERTVRVAEERLSVAFR
jgi:integrase